MNMKDVGFGLTHLSWLVLHHGQVVIQMVAQIKIMLT